MNPPRLVDRLGQNLDAVEHLETKTLPVYVDVRLAVASYRGMGKYLRELLASCPTPFTSVGSTGGSDPFLGDVKELKPSFYPLWEQLAVPQFLRHLPTHVFVAPFNTGPIRLHSNTKLVLIVHDLIFLQSFRELPLRGSSRKKQLARLYRRWNVPQAVKRANQLLTVSETSKAEIATRLCVADEKIAVVPNVVSFQELRPEQPMERSGRRLLAVSGSAPNKNLAALMEAVQSIDDMELELTVVGVRESEVAKFRFLVSAQANQRITFTDRISDDELARLYRESTALVFPSLVEGFGIPLIESMYYGLPIICSRASCFPEIAGEAAEFFDPRSPADIAAAIRRALDPAGLDMLARRSYTRHDLYSKDKFQRRAVTFWENVLAP